MSNADRRSRLAAAIADAADAVLVTKPVNVRYLTGFTGSHGAVLVTAAADAVLATDGRYETQAASESPGMEVLIGRSLPTELAQRAASAGVRRLAVERHHMTVATHDRLTADVPAVELVDAGEPVESLRLTKDDGELAAITTACRITDDVFAAVLADVAPGVSELDISWRLRSAMRERGAEPAFDSIVAFGPHSAIPHHQPTDRVLAAGDLVKLDFGAQVDGYHADMTRTIVCGTAQDWQRELHALVREVQREGRAAAVPGAVPVQVDAAVRARIEAAGHAFPHGLGHGVGLEIHESPFVVPSSTAATLVERIPVTIEPGVYLPGRGGVRIEDTVVVRAGGAESLTTSPRELIEI